MVDNFWAAVVGLDEVALLCMATPEFKIHVGGASSMTYRSEDIRFTEGSSLEALARSAVARIIRQMQAYGWVLTGTIKHAQLKSPDSFDPADKAYQMFMGEASKARPYPTWDMEPPAAPEPAPTMPVAGHSSVADPSSHAEVIDLCDE